MYRRNKNDKKIQQMDTKNESIFGGKENKRAKCSRYN